MIKILAACGAGVNSNHQIKSALEEELSNPRFWCSLWCSYGKDVNEDLIKGYDIFTPIAATDLGFWGIPVIEAGQSSSVSQQWVLQYLIILKRLSKEHGLS